MNRTWLAAGLTSAAILASALWGGMLNDRHVIGLGEGLMGLVGLPLAACLAALGLVLAWWQPAGDRLRPTIVGGAALGLVVWSAVSLSETYNLSEGISTLIILLCAVSAGAAAASLSRIRPVAWTLIMVLVTAAAIISAMGVSEYVVHASTKDTSWRVFSTFTMPNFLAGYLVMLIPLVAAVYLGSRIRMVTILSAVTLALSAACLLLTQSRFGLLCMALAGLLFVVLAALRGSLTGSARLRLIVILGICLFAGGIFARPVLRRLGGAQSESYSSQFRKSTWVGSVAMAQQNPLLGTGLGSYDTAYARYAVVGFTEHAHNSYLQAAAELGMPGAIFLIVCLVAPYLFAVRAARKAETPEGAPFDHRLVAAGIAAGIVGALLRNVVDSDLYVGANAVTFAVLSGLALGLAGPAHAEAVEEAQQGKDRAKKAVKADRQPVNVPAMVRRAAAVCIMLVAFVFGSRQALSRAHAAAYYQEMEARNGQAALEEIEAAVAADGSNPDFRLNLAEFRSRSRDIAGADAEFRNAIKSAPIGKSYFRYGKFLLTQGRPGEAAGMFERAEKADPHYQQNLLLLADAYRASGKPDKALEVYLRMVELYVSPVGQLRAVPEQVPWEFGFAYLGLGEDQLVKGDQRDALNNLREGCAILANWWDRRNDVRNQVRPDQWTTITQRYQWALQQYAANLRQQGNAQEAAKVDAKLASYKSELESANAERQKQASAPSG